MSGPSARGAVDGASPGSRLVIVPLARDGFGFTLRHFVVYPPLSVSKAERAEPQHTIFVKAVRPGSGAEWAGLKTGDRLLAINGKSLVQLTYAQVLALVQSCRTALHLQVMPREGDPLQAAYPRESVEMPATAQLQRRSQPELEAAVNASPRSLQFVRKSSEPPAGSDGPSVRIYFRHETPPNSVEPARAVLLPASQGSPGGRLIADSPVSHNTALSRGSLGTAASTPSPAQSTERLTRRCSYLRATSGPPSSRVSPPSRVTPDRAVTPPRRHNIDKLKLLLGEVTPVVESAQSASLYTALSQHCSHTAHCFLKAVPRGQSWSEVSWRPAVLGLRGDELVLAPGHTVQLEKVVTRLLPEASRFIIALLNHSAGDREGKDFLISLASQSELLFWQGLLNTAQASIASRGDFDMVRPARSESGSGQSLTTPYLSENNPRSDDRLKSIPAASQRTRRHPEVRSRRAGYAKSRERSCDELTMDADSGVVTDEMDSGHVRKDSSSASRTYQKHGDQKKESRKWTAKIGRSFKRMTSSTELEQADFLSRLETCEPSLSNKFVPAVVELCTAIIEARALDTVGIYRLSGNQAAVNQLMEELKKGLENVNFDSERWLDVHVVAGLLKQFLRRLAEPIIPADLYSHFITAYRITDYERRLLSVKRLLAQLSDHSFETLLFLCTHLHTVTQHSSTNKMDTNNLAIIFAPTLFRQMDAETAVMEMGDQCGLLYTLVKNCHWFASGWENDSAVPEQGEDEILPMPQYNVPPCSASSKKPTPKEIVSRLITDGVQKMKKRKSVKRERNRTLKEPTTCIDISPARHNTRYDLGQRSHSAENLQKEDLRLADLQAAVHSLQLREEKRTREVARAADHDRRITEEIRVLRSEVIVRNTSVDIASPSDILSDFYPSLRRSFDTHADQHLS